MTIMLHPTTHSWAKQSGPQA